MGVPITHSPIMAVSLSSDIVDRVKHLLWKLSKELLSGGTYDLVFVKFVLHVVKITLLKLELNDRLVLANTRIHHLKSAPIIMV